MVEHFTICAATNWDARRPILLQRMSMFYMYIATDKRILYHDVMKKKTRLYSGSFIILAVLFLFSPSIVSCTRNCLSSYGVSESRGNIFGVVFILLGHCETPQLVSAMGYENTRKRLRGSWSRKIIHSLKRRQLIEQAIVFSRSYLHHNVPWPSRPIAQVPD